MRKLSFLFILFLLAVSYTAVAQDTLPKILIKNISGKIIVSWKNEYNAVVTIIDIQRSNDSIRNFSTIGTVLNPLNEDNGYVDTRPPKTKCYYRLFIAFEGGSYKFTKSYRIPKDTASKRPNNIIVPVKTPEPDKVIAPIKTPVPDKIIAPPIKTVPDKPIVVKTPLPDKVIVPAKIPIVKKDSVTINKPVVIQPVKKDSIAVVVKEELLRLNRFPKKTVIIDKPDMQPIAIAAINDIVLIKYRLMIDIYPDCRDLKRKYINIRRDSTDIIARMPFRPSKFINIGKDNDVIINLPLSATKKYSIKFYGEKDSAVLFEINKITEPYLILEKVNFKHSGWFRYHLYCNGLLVEKYKIYVAIDDKTIPMAKERADLSKDR
ncbi:MAG TPA: hypothetical protein VK718_01600 [Ferruginibacter sp.]|jgi:hypothetical protein|nr:hypothetical protein [Ferruginibacter sp.]